VNRYCQGVEVIRDSLLGFFWGCDCGAGGEAANEEELASQVYVHAPDLADRIRAGVAA
jgi:hypothetical protein